MRYCDPVKSYWGWKFEGLSNANELHEIISKFMIRRLKKDVLKDLPPKVRSVIPMKVKISDRKLYDDADRELELAIKNKEKNALSKLEALKQASFGAKINSMIGWIKDYLEINEKLVVFIWHRESCEILEREFAGISVSITGSTPVKERQKMVEKFQNDSKIKLFIGQIKSAGVGLTLTKSRAVAFLEFGTTAPGMEQAEDRVHRIGQGADSVLAYYLIMENSIDEQIMEVLNRRNKDLKMVMNNENEDLFEPKKEKEFGDLIIEEYKKKKNLK
jgi:SNF2 family DNA or RNA helicase